MRHTTRRVSLILLAAASFAVAQSMTTAPATSPTTLPDMQPSSQPSTEPTTAPSTQASATTQPARPHYLPGDYVILDTRSIFLKGHVSPYSAAPATISPPTVTTHSPESSVVFSGVTEIDGTYTAMFEDTAAGRIVQCKPGDAIAQGKIMQITLDSVTYQTPGRTTRVLVGQTLDAGEAPDVASRASITTDSTGTPTTAPSGGNDVLERLRAKRRQELR